MNLRFSSNVFCITVFFLFSAISKPSFAGQPFPQGSNSVSLVECVKKTLQSNPKLLSKMDERNASELRCALAETAKMPRVKAEEIFTRMRQPLSVALGAAPMSIGDDKLQIKTLRVSQPLYTGGKIENGIRAARSEVYVRRFSEIQLREDLARQVAEAYVGLMTAKALQQVASQALFDTQGHAKQVENMLQFGSVVRNDLLKIQVSVSERRENLIKANNAVKLTCTSLANLVGYEISTDAILANFTYAMKPPADEKTALEMASNKHPALLALRESLRLHRFATQSAKGDLRPNLGMQWNFNSGNQFNESQSNWDATLYVGFNVFDAGEARTKVKEAQTGYKKASHDLEGIQRDISLAVQQAILRMEEANARLEVAKEAEVQAKESMRLTEESFKAGAATSQNLLDDESALVAAEQRRITANFDRVLAETHLWFSVGGLEKALLSTVQPAANAFDTSIATTTLLVYTTGENK